MDNPPSNRLRKIAAGFIVFMVFGILHTWVIFPPILRAILRSQVVLKNGTQMRDMYNALPFPLIFKVHLFNVLNPDEVMKGAKPKLQEVGPYVFEEWKVKVDQVEDLVEDTIEFTAINYFIYNQTLSNGLTGDEEITVINPLLTSLGLAINRDRPPLLPTVAAAINEIFHVPKTAFWTGKVMDLLFNGFDVDCTSEDFNSKTVCSAFDTGDIKTVAPKDDIEDMYKFALFMTANGTDAGRYKTYRGVKNIFNLGKVIEYNGEPELDIWDGDECNEIRGTESSIFPPFGAKEDGVWAFESGICRSMKLRYERPSKYRGIPTLRFHGDLEDIAADESMHCYCSDDKCPLKGTLDLFPCTEGPIVASMPHFFNGDPALLEKIDSGLVPDKDKHAIFLDFEIISGTPMSAAKRLQVNIDMMPLPEIDVMKELPEMLFPLMWIEEGADLNKTFVNMLKYQLFLGLKYQAAVKWISIIVGPIGAVTVLFLDYQKRNAEKITAVLKVSPTNGSSNDNDDHSKALSSATTQELSVEKERY
uniref:Sensory neuron membrane protein 1 n=1 Tax=Bradysia odoriphaga TaxID=1564500 RepID=A0A6B9C9V8_9DIPT|nr:sensory neuron membrane protein 1c [Bradysia odoriphaga]